MEAAGGDRRRGAEVTRAKGDGARRPTGARGDGAQRNQPGATGDGAGPWPAGAMAASEAGAGPWPAGAMAASEAGDCRRGGGERLWGKWIESRERDEREMWWGGVRW